MTPNLQQLRRELYAASARRWREQAMRYDRVAEQTLSQPDICLEALKRAEQDREWAKQDEALAR